MLLNQFSWIHFDAVWWFVPSFLWCVCLSSAIQGSVSASLQMLQESLLTLLFPLQLFMANLAKLKLKPLDGVLHSAFLFGSSEDMIHIDTWHDWQRPTPQRPRPNRRRVKQRVLGGSSVEASVQPAASSRKKQMQKCRTLAASLPSATQKMHSNIFQPCRF